MPKGGEVASSGFLSKGPQATIKCKKTSYGRWCKVLSKYGVWLLDYGHPIVAIRGGRDQNGGRIGKKVYMLVREINFGIVYAVKPH